MESDKERDRFSFDYCLYGLAFFLVFPISECFPGDNGADIAVFFLMLFVGFILALFFIIILIMHLWKKRWRRAASLFISPFIGVAVSLVITRSQFPHWLYLQVHKSAYLEQIAREPHVKDAPMKKSFHVGGYGMVASAGGEYSIDYDESDAVATLPKTNPCVSVAHLEGHFYYVTTEENECADLHP